MNSVNLDKLIGYNVLYLEDEVALLRQTAVVLEDFVGKIFPCQNVNDAMQILKTEEVDIIISDILLENSTGIDFIKEIREQNFHTPVIFATAYTDTKFLLDAIKVGASGYIIKPINIKELLNTLYTALIGRIKDSELKKDDWIIKTISAVTETKDVKMIKFLINNLDEQNCFNYAQSEIMENIDVSKPTVIKLFKSLMDLGIISKMQNSKYKFHPEILENLEI